MTARGSELVQALLAARADVNARVFKAGYNQAQKYSFVGHEQVIEHSRSALLKHGLVLVQDGVDFEGEAEYATRSGPQRCWRWRGHFMLMHTSGAEMAFHFTATTGTNDKAGFVASTALDRTAHMRILELAGSDQENPEDDSNEQEPPREQPRYERPQTQQQPAQQQPAENAGALSVIDEFRADLARLKTRDEIVRWAKDLLALRMRPDLKQPAWDEFGPRCADLELSPAEVAAEARRRNAA